MNTADQDVRLACLQMATEIHCQFSGGSDSKTVLKTAGEFYDWVNGKTATVLRVVAKDEQL